MKVEFRNNKDFLAGLIFIIIGLAALVISQKNYPMGTSTRMGPSYFPTVLGGIMAALGLCVMVRGLIKGVKIEGVWGIRPLVLVSLGFVAFGFLIDKLGLAPALFALFFISALGGHQFKEVLILAIVMTTASWCIFIYGLGLPYRLFFLGN
jgi:uncharacterized membrane protein YidH (DUF202 family)